MSANDPPDNALFRVYERYIGEPDAETDVYLGFGLFFVAVGVGLLSLLLFVGGVGLHGFRGDGYYAWAEPAYAFGMFSLPLLMLGIVVLLPVKKRATAAASVGVAIVAVAVGWFWLSYPDNWAEFGAGNRRTLEVAGLYSVGMLVVLSSTGAALVAHQLERVRAPSPSEVADAEQTDEDEGETISDEEIERDIEEAMADVDLTWGGVEKTEHSRLQLNTDFADDAIEAGNVDVDSANKRVESGGVDEQVQGLRSMKGGDTKTATSESTVDDQTAALNELKRQKETDEVPDNAPTASQGILGRVLDRVGLT